MKFYSGEYYEYVSPCSLSWRSAERYSSVDEAIKGAKEMNEREYTRGFTPSDWIVVRTTWNRCTEDDGTFVSENSSTVAIKIEDYLD